MVLNEAGGSYIMMPANKSCRLARRGFSLMEVLLVVVIMGIAMGIAMPAMVRSIAGNRLRTAGRALISSARYARSMSILHQVPLSLRFNLDQGGIEVTSPDPATQGQNRVMEGVRLQSLQIEDQDAVSEGLIEIQFSRNGTCRPFTVTLTDNSGNTMTIQVDALASVKSRTFTGN